MDILQPGKESKELTIDQLRLKKAALVLRAINHPLRQQMLHRLHQKSECCVTDLYHTLRLEQSVASQHLSILRRAGVVATRREGKQIYYSVNPTRFTEVTQFAEALLN